MPGSQDPSGKAAKAHALLNSWNDTRPSPSSARQIGRLPKHFGLHNEMTRSRWKKGGSPCQSTPNSSSSFSCMALLSSCWTWMTWFQIQSKKCERYYYIYCIYIYVYNHHARFRASVWCLVLIEKTVSAIRQERLATRKAIQNWQMKTSHFPLCRWLTSQKWTNCHGISMIVAGWNHLNSTQTNHINPILRFPKIVVPLNHQFS
jgi:hypothetical protein